MAVAKCHPGGICKISCAVIFSPSSIFGKLERLVEGTCIENVTWEQTKPLHMKSEILLIRLKSTV